MKAYLAERYGGPEVMHLGELPEPVASKGEVVVTVRASSVNAVDWKIRAGQLRFISGSKFPRALGTDFAGVIHSLGEGVRDWAVGDEVYGFTVTATGSPGTHAERVAVPVTALRRKPASMTFEQAATLPVAALTALHGMRVCGVLAGKSLLINGATGGVGHFVLQIAKARGAHVTAVCSARNAALATQLGATEVIDYRTQDFTTGSNRYDIIYDAHGYLKFGKARRVLNPKGQYVTPLGLPTVYLRSLVQNLFTSQRLLVANVRSEPQDYTELETLVTSGVVRPVIDRVLPLAQAGEAFAASERGGLAGKIVIAP